MTRNEVTRLLAYFAETFPNTRPPEQPTDRIDAWYSALDDQPADGIYAAARIIVQADEFHPSVHRCISVMVSGTAETGVIPRVRVRRYLEGRGGRALGEQTG
jgi:hypothetical protein